MPQCNVTESGRTFQIGRNWEFFSDNSYALALFCIESSTHFILQNQYFLLQELFYTVDVLKVVEAYYYYHFIHINIFVQTNPYIFYSPIRGN